MSISIGNQAEDSAARYLVDLGFEIIDRNWKTRVCEIDIVAKKHKRLFFVEVKYRSSSEQGTGLDYITPKKLQQMLFAAQNYITDHSWPGDICMSAIEVTGDFKITAFIESIE